MPISRIKTDGINDDAITSAKIGVDVIVADDLAANSVTVSELTNNAVTTAKIANGAITDVKLATDSVGTDAIGTGVVGTTQIAADAVTGDKLANNITIAGTTTSTGTFTASALSTLVGSVTHGTDSGDTRFNFNGPNQYRLTIKRGGNIAGQIGGGGADDLRFSNAAGATTMALKSGKLGVGTESPSSKLHLYSGASGGTPQSRAALIIEDSDGNGDSLQFLGSDSNFQAIFFGDASDNDVGRIAYSHSGNNMRFSVDGAEQMRIDNTGLLIGTTSTHPSRLLATRPNIGVTAFFESTSTHGTGIQVIHTSMASQSNNTNTAHFKATTQGIGSWHLYGNGSSSFSSDERLKKNIETSRDGYLSDLAKLRVVKYNWKLDEDSKSKELGLIAQEVQTVFPSLVVESNDEGLGLTDALSIKNSVLPIITIKAMQELKAELDAEKTKTTKLEAQVADLIDRITALESN